MSFGMQSYLLRPRLYLYQGPSFYSWISPMPSHIIGLLTIICGGYCGQSSDVISLGIGEIQL